MKTSELIIEYLTSRESEVVNTYYYYPKYKKSSSLIKLIEDLASEEVEESLFTYKEFEDIKQDEHLVFQEVSVFNTYNSSSPFIIQATEIKNTLTDEIYTAVEIHSGGDARGNYLSPIILKCDKYDFYEILSNNTMSFSLDNKVYYQNLTTESGLISDDEGNELSIFDNKNNIENEKLNLVHEYMCENEWDVNDNEFCSIVIGPFIYIYSYEKGEIVKSMIFDESDKLATEYNMDEISDIIKTFKLYDTLNIKNHFYKNDKDEFIITIPSNEKPAIATIITISDNDSMKVEAITNIDENLPFEISSFLNEWISRSQPTLF